MNSGITGASGPKGITGSTPKGPAVIKPSKKGLTGTSGPQGITGSNLIK